MWKIFLLLIGYAVATGYGNDYHQQQQLQQLHQQHVKQQQILHQQQLQQQEQQLYQLLKHQQIQQQTDQRTPQQVNNIDKQQRRSAIPGLFYHSELTLQSIQYLLPPPIASAALQQNLPDLSIRIESLTQNPIDSSPRIIPYSQNPLQALYTQNPTQPVLRRVALSRSAVGPPILRTSLTQTSDDATTQAGVIPASPSQLAAQLTPAPFFPPQNHSVSPQSVFNQNPHDQFSTNLFQAIAPSNPQRNVIYSPISLQTLLAFIYVGSLDSTALELQTALRIPGNATEVSYLFQRILQTQQKTSDAELIMANKLFYNNNLRVNDRLQQYAQVYFGSGVEATQFDTPTLAAQNINAWVADATNNRITNLIQPNVLDAGTTAILVNAIYFKAKWVKEFSTLDTEKHDFHTSLQRTVPVDMMYIEDTFRWGDFPSLQAKVLEMPYKDSDLSMLVILPDDRYGLAMVEQRLSKIDLGQLAANLKTELVTLRMPKFKIEFEIDMVEPLQRLGIHELFSNNAQLGGFFNTHQPVSISKVQHKAFIDVNEAGSEAAAASFAKFIPLSLPPRPIYFTVDHAFMFAIRSPQAVYFIGHVVA